MNTNEQLAQDDARHEDGPAPETKARRPGAPSAVRSPAILTRRASPLARLTRQVEAQTAQIRAVTSAEARRRLAEARGRATHALREAADQRYEAIARRRAPDVLITDKINRINGAHDAIDRAERAERRSAILAAENRKLRRPPAPALANRGGAATQHKQAQMLHRAALVHYLRTGEKSFRGVGLTELERRAAPSVKTIWGGNGPSGGFLLMPEHDTGPMERLLAEVVPMRQHAEVRTINAYTYKKPVRTSTGGARWGNELQNGGQTETPKYSLLDFPAHNLYAEPVVSTDALEDSYINLEQEISDGCLEDFSVAEGAVWIAGDGVERPFGILGYGAAAYVDNDDWAWGKVGFKKTGAAGGFPAAPNSGDPIVKLQYELKQMYRGAAKWMMNRLTIGVCRTLKMDDRYIWSDGSIINGTPATLDGREVIEAEEMPEIGADSFSIALADWNRAYVIVDRVGMNVLRDEISAYPSVAFKTRKRVGGGIKNFEAIKLLKFSN